MLSCVQMHIQHVCWRCAEYAHSQIRSCFLNWGRSLTSSNPTLQDHYYKSEPQWLLGWGGGVKGIRNCNPSVAASAMHSTVEFLQVIRSYTMVMISKASHLLISESKCCSFTSTTVSATL